MGFDIGDMFGGVISGGMKLLGGYLDNQANKKNQLEAFQRSFDAQQFENTHSIQQRVADAKAAGINPYYAIGAPTMSAPGATAFSSQLGSAMGDAGQDISRAVKAGLDHDDRVKALTEEGLKLDNDIKKAAIAKTYAQLGPSIPNPSKDEDQFDPKETSKAPGSGANYPGMSHRQLNTVFGPLTAHPDMSEAQEWENDYGDIGDKVGGLNNLLAAGWFKALRKVAPESARRILDRASQRRGEFGPYLRGRGGPGYRF